MAAPAGRSLSTRLVLLLEVHNRRHAKLRTLSERLGVTPQAVSVYLKRLTREGLVESRDGAWRPTQKGTEALHRAMRDLRRFVDEAAGNLRFIDETIAQADAVVRSGDEVGLYMSHGRLKAAPRVYAGSHGRALSAARKGELVRVGDLRGIVLLKPAPLTVIAHPVRLSETQMRRARALVQRAGSNGSSPRVAAHDLTSALLLERLQRAADFEFAPMEASLDAARRGVPVQYFVPEPDAAECLATLARLSASGPEAIPVRSVQL